MPSTVLIVSAQDDWSAVEVAARLAARDRRCVWLDPGQFPQSLSVSASFDQSWTTELIGESDRVRLDDVASVFYRRPGDFRMPAGMSGPEERFARAQARVGLGGVLASLPARWVNHPANLADADYKPRQLTLAVEAGFSTPRTLISNEPDAVREFAGQVGDLIVKPLADPIVNEAGTYTPVWTRRVTPADLADLAGVEITLHLFQEWIPKSAEVRLTAVGDRLFPVEITAGSPAAQVDWRSDYDALTYRRIDCPPEIAASVARYLTASGLRYGAFDFVLTPDGQWVFLECNAAGQWGWLAEECDLPIAEAIADELTGDAA